MCAIAAFSNLLCVLCRVWFVHHKHPFSVLFKVFMCCNLYVLPLSYSSGVSHILHVWKFRRPVYVLKWVDESRYGCIYRRSAANLYVKILGLAETLCRDFVKFEVQIFKSRRVMSWCLGTYLSKYTMFNDGYIMIYTIMTCILKYRLYLPQTCTSVSDSCIHCTLFFIYLNHTS